MDIAMIGALIAISIICYNMYGKKKNKKDKENAN